MPQLQELVFWRAGILDPIHYFISSVFIQFVIAALTRAIAPLVERALLLLLPPMPAAG